MKPTVTLDKTVDTKSMIEPGGTFNYTRHCHQHGAEPVQIEEFSDSNLEAWDPGTYVFELLLPGRRTPSWSTTRWIMLWPGPTRTTYTSP